MVGREKWAIGLGYDHGLELNPGPWRITTWCLSHLRGEAILTSMHAGDKSFIHFHYYIPGHMSGEGQH